MVIAKVKRGTISVHNYYHHGAWELVFEKKAIIAENALYTSIKQKRLELEAVVTILYVVYLLNK